MAVNMIVCRETVFMLRGWHGTAGTMIVRESFDIRASMGRLDRGTAARTFVSYIPSMSRIAVVAIGAPDRRADFVGARFRNPRPPRAAARAPSPATSSRP